MSKSKPIKVELQFDTNRSALSAGFRVNWIDGEDDESRVNLSCGAGVGSPFIIFSKTDKKTDKTRYAIADIRPVIDALAAAL